MNIKTIENPNRITSYWKAQWKVGLMIIISGLLFDCSMSLGPILQGKIIDFIINGKPADVVIRWIVFYVIIIAIIQFARYLKRYYVRDFANRTNTSMRMIIYDNIIRRDVQDLSDEKIGDLMTKAISDVGACVEGMRKFTTEIFDTGVLMASYFVVMLLYDVKITIYACMFIPLAMFIAEKLKVIIYKYSNEYRKQLSRVSEIALENIENEMLFRVNGVNKIRMNSFDKELIDLQKKATLANVLENSMQPVYNAISMIGVLAVVYLGGIKAIEGNWTVGEFSAYMTIFIAFAVKAAKAAKLFNSVQKAKISWERIKPYLNKCEEPKEQYIEKAKKVNIKVDKLSFRKIKDCNFTLRTGEIIGVTGPVASGKSTIGIALSGIYPYKGSITINGKELREMSHEEICSYVSYMGHDNYLLSDTIYNNITLGKDGNIAQIMEDIAFDVDLAEMEDGVNTLIGTSGIRLSGGQQSRIALGRALYNRGSLLVLDDPFSAVDEKTEKRIIAALREHYSDTAILIISHRICGFSNLDRVIVVSDGVTMVGTHQEMLESSSVYMDIYSIQNGGGNCE